MGFLTDGSTLTWQQIQSPLHVILAAAAAGADDATTTAAAAAAANNNHHDAASRSTVAHKILTDGVLQFLSIWRKNKERANDPFLWGDEVRAPASSRSSASLPISPSESHATDSPCLLAHDTGRIHCGGVRYRLEDRALVSASERHPRDPSGAGVRRALVRLAQASLPWLEHISHDALLLACCCCCGCSIARIWLTGLPSTAAS